MQTLRRRCRLLGSLGAAALVAALPFASPAAAHNSYPSAESATPGSAAYAQLPLAFEPNYGQSSAPVDFVARGSGYSIGLNATSATLGLRDLDVRMQVIGGQSQPALATQALEGKVNYLLGNDPSEWHTDISTFGRVSYQDVYPGIDLTYYGQQTQLEYDFVVTPGASHQTIRLGFEAADGLEVDDRGDLVLHTPQGELRQARPTIYQQVDGERRSVEGGFVVRDREVGFEVGAYDASQPLVIDPAIQYSTFLGGKGDENFWGNVWSGGIAVDAAGSAYVVGSTTSPNFPVTGGALQPAFKDGGMDVFVAKLNPAGSALVYSTYLGGRGFEMGMGIAIDRPGNAYVTGLTNSDNFPIVSALQPTFGGGAEDAFVTKLNPTGSGLVYSTYLGGSGAGWGESAYAIDVDSAGQAYVTGVTNSPDFPLVNAFQSTVGGLTDVFVAKLKPTGAGLVYSTFMGGLGEDAGRGIGIDSSGSAYVTGQVSSDGLASPGVLQPTRSGPSDAFAAKFGPAGNRVYSTYIGGGGDEIGFGVAADTHGNAYLAGRTGGTFYITPGWFNQTCLDPAGYVAKLNPTATALVYAGCLDGPGKDGAMALALDRAENVYVTGFTTSTKFPLADAFQTTLKGTQDAFVSKINASGTVLAYSSYLGGTRTEAGVGIAVDSSGHAYVTGLTGSGADFPLKAPLQPTYGGGAYDAFVVKIDCGL
jgi:hypothetical protein